MDIWFTRGPREVLEALSQIVYFYPLVFGYCMTVRLGIQWNLDARVKGMSNDRPGEFS